MQLLKLIGIYLTISVYAITGCTGRASGTKGSSNSLGSGNSFFYKAKRYGSYHSTTYFSYSGGLGYARYARVYSTHKNFYRQHYSKLFDWLKTEQYTVYKNTPSDYISVCKNYEANDNGTYLGIFTCPLPIFPGNHKYCCGVTNAEYCCTFWDVPLNVVAACVIGLMGIVIMVTIICIIYMLQRTKHIQRVTVKRKRSLFRRQTLKEIEAMLLMEARRSMDSGGSNSDLCSQNTASTDIQIPVPQRKEWVST